MQKYQNLTDHELIIPNVGVISSHGTIETDSELNSPHLKRITNQQPAAPVPSAPAPVQPAPQPVQAAPEPPKEGEH